MHAPIAAQSRALFEKEYAMNKAETNRFHRLYERHLRLLKLQGKAQKTIDAYARGVRRISEHFGLGPNFARLDGGTIKKEVQMRKYGTF